MLRKTAVAVTVLLGMAITSCAAPAEATKPTSAQPAVPVGSRVGELAPDFSLVDITGQTVRLSDFRGKPVLINFWATWCPPCREEMPYLQQIHDESSSKGLVMLAVNVGGESPATVKQFLSANKLSMRALIDGDGNVAQDYAVEAIPSTFFVDGNGVIKQKIIGAFPSRQAIQMELKKIMP